MRIRAARGHSLVRKRGRWNRGRGKKVKVVQRTKEASRVDGMTICNLVAVYGYGRG